METRMEVFGICLLCMGLAGLGLGIMGCSDPVESKAEARVAGPDTPPPEAGVGEAEVARAVSGESTDATAARARASAEGKYLFAFFWKTQDEQTRAMRTVFQKAMKQASDRADAVSVQVTDPAQKAIVDEYGLDRAPMPLVLSIAPNGAVTGGFPTAFTEEDLLDAFATPCTERCMKFLQDGKLVFLCIQNGQTEANAEAIEGVRAFKDDPQYASATELVMLDPADEAEAGFLRDLQIPSAPPEAMTVFLVPPGSPIATIKGATNKELLVQTLQKASSGCCPGGACGPGGCAPQ